MTERLHFHFSLSFIGESNVSPLQSSCLENPRDSRAWWAAVYGVAHWNDWTGLKQLSSSNSNNILSTVLCSKLHKSTTACRGCTHVTIIPDPWNKTSEKFRTILDSQKSKGSSCVSEVSHKSHISLGRVTNSFLRFFLLRFSYFLPNDIFLFQELIPYPTLYLVAILGYGNLSDFPYFYDLDSFEEFFLVRHFIKCSSTWICVMFFLLVFGYEFWGRKTIDVDSPFHCVILSTCLIPLKVDFWPPDWSSVCKLMPLTSYSFSHSSYYSSSFPCVCV